MVRQSAFACRSATLRNNPVVLRSELELLRRRLDTMTELTDDALKRLTEIVETKELEQEQSETV
jgi:hypothetical protein